jgi:hypothetical protein
MATVKLQDGKVVLKDRKVSCECCGGKDCRMSFGVSDKNVFEITKQEYDRYFNGRTWLFEGSFSARSQVNLQSGSQCSKVYSGGISEIVNASGIGNTGCRNVAITNSDLNIDIQNSGPCRFTESPTEKASYFPRIRIDLGTLKTNLGKKYYIKYDLQGALARYEIPPTSPDITRFPANGSYSVDGRQLSYFYYWSDLLRGIYDRPPQAIYTTTATESLRVTLIA